MTQTETKTRKNTDYSASAVNLTNPPELRDLLSRLHEAQGNANEIKDRIDALIPVDLLKASEQIADIIASLNADIRAGIEALGSYQDIINGAYAVKQRRISLSYDPKELRAWHPAEAELVIEESVNATRINGLIKGGLLDLRLLLSEGVARELESYAYVIR